MTGLTIKRCFTKAGEDPYESVTYERRDSIIKNPDGSTVFEIKGVEVPTGWSQLATDILAQKYLRKTGVPQRDGNGKPLTDKDGQPLLGSETSIRQVAHRLAGTWRHWGEQYGYFASEEDAQAFYDELVWLLLHQRVAPNSPQWFNTGLAWAYGIKGEAQGHWYVDPKTGKLVQSEDAYTRPQPHACFIQSLRDDLVNKGGIFDLLTREALIFKYGSGTGSNFSALRGRGEPLSGGGTSSGLMSFLKVFDAGAGAIKSGGTTRRAAKMVCLDMDHPEIETFIMWKYREEQKVADLVTGSFVNRLFLAKVAAAARQGTDWRVNKELKLAISEARRFGVSMNYIFRLLQLADQGIHDPDFLLFDTQYEGEAYQTVSGQNANNSVRVPNAFLKAVEQDETWNLTKRTDGKVWKTVKAKELWEKVCLAAWHSADPGVQFDTTISEWHTCPKDGRIRASNPCVTGDTRVLTRGGRWYRIDEIVHKPTTILVNQGRLSEAMIDGSFRTGRKPVYELTTKSGYSLKLTADHKVFTVNRGFVSAYELTKDDHLLFPDGLAGPLEEPKDPTFYQLLGLFLGDGCGDGGTGRALQLTMEKEQEGPILEKVNEYVAMYERQTHKDSPATVVMTATSGRVTITNQIVVEKMRTFLDLSRKSHEKYLSDAIFALPLGAQKYILQGLFTADGTVADYGEKSQYVALDSTSLQLLRDVQLLLLGFGIKSKLYTNRRAGKLTALLPDGHGGHKEYPVREMHSLRISRSSRIRFEELVGFMEESPKSGRLHLLNERVAVYADRPIDPVASLRYLGEEEVYDLTEPLTHSFIANGAVIHNCSEYMFLDDTACNLASLNVATFLDEDGAFDIEGFEHAARLLTIVLEISVLMAQFVSEEMAMKSYQYRTLGLGYANIGSALMRLGIPYDSDEGRAYIGAVTALLSGTAYRTSAELAAHLGPFDRYQANRESMLRVIRNHRRAAYNASADEYEGLTITPQGVDERLAPPALLKAARQAWDETLSRGEQHGFRNAQVTVLAPTGTIGLVMDCDTTGIEPDFALVKFKKLAGGGYFKIINQSVPPALKRLGYAREEVDAIITYAVGHATLRGAPAINHDTLKAKGFTDDLLQKVEANLATAFDLTFVFNPYTLGEDGMARLGVPKEEYEAQGFNLLERLGFTKEAIAQANEYVCGTMTVEGAPGLKEEHLPVFDCASKCGKRGKRFLSAAAHIKAMAAAQPFLSGAISKTINMPNEATIAEISEAYLLSWKLMVKATALYRDGSKLSQPLNTVAQELSAFDEEVPPEEVQQAIAARHEGTPEWEGIRRAVEIIGKRLSLVTHEYEDGRLGNIEFAMPGEPDAWNGLLQAYADLALFSVERGIPLGELVERFTFTDFPPGGPVQGDPAVKNATSVIDYLYRVLGFEYLGRQDLVHLKGAKPTRQHGERQKRVLSAEERLVAEAKAKGYTGDRCPECGSLRLKRNGTCALCEDCGATTLEDEERRIIVKRV